ncbi:hypothetical protein NDU88_008814 [Pleurodeles waltl]|uniref:Uncharacterized protein n=1 Tax=Pleurodeles waltl TaxID=8319 RepID=A0AAV7P009_PLEWA|nr:hypothetical protein NDU88_008814 [Pleurodeles waltl]
MGSPIATHPHATHPDERHHAVSRSHHRGRDTERATRSHGDRDMVLQAVAHLTQIQEWDKSRFSLKPALTQAELTLLYFIHVPDLERTLGTASCIHPTAEYPDA